MAVDPTVRGYTSSQLPSVADMTCTAEAPEASKPTCCLYMELDGLLLHVAQIELVPTTSL